MSPKKYDVLVAGSGPAGLAVAGKCSKLGLRTACISPDINKKWENNYGVWKEEIKGLGYDDTFNHSWEYADWIFNEKLTRTFNYPYGQFDREKLKAKIISQGDRNNLELIEARLKNLEHKNTSTLVNDDKGTQYETSIVVDASGFEPVFLNRRGKKADVWQIAYGVMARVDKHPFPLDRFTMMDFRCEFLNGDDSPPTICYIMPFERDKIFFEETSIVDRPAVKMDMLQERLRKRLKSIDVNIKDKEWEEFCYIPTNPPLPDFGQRVIGFGTAGGLMHSNTGYCVALSLNLAPVLAETIYNGLNSMEASPENTAMEAWKVVWPSWRKRMSLFNRAGMELFCAMSIRQLSLFLRMFFSFPDEVWHGYLSNNTPFFGLTKEFLKGLTRKIMP